MKNSEILTALAFGGGGESGYPEPTGSITITANGTHDVKDKASAIVEVPVPSGTILIERNGTYGVKNLASAEVFVEPITYTSSATFTIAELQELAAAEEPRIMLPVSGEEPYWGDGTTYVIVEGQLEGSSGKYHIYGPVVDKSNITVLGQMISIDPIDSSGGDGDILADAFDVSGSGANIKSNATTIPASAFETSISSSSGWKIRSVELPLCTEIGANAFCGSTYLTSLKAPLLSYIYDSAFAGDYSLGLVDIGDYSQTYSSPYIGLNVFSGGASLLSLVLRYNSVITLMSTSALENTAIANGYGYIYVPQSVIAQYRTATNWSTYKNQMRVLEDYTDDGTPSGEFLG